MTDPAMMPWRRDTAKQSLMAQFLSVDLSSAFCLRLALSINPTLLSLVTIAVSWTMGHWRHWGAFLLAVACDSRERARGMRRLQLS